MVELPTTEDTIGHQKKSGKIIKPRNKSIIVAAKVIGH
jgi:hypothetical protein